MSDAAPAFTAYAPGWAISKTLGNRTPARICVPTVSRPCVLQRTPGLGLSPPRRRAHAEDDGTVVLVGGYGNLCALVPAAMTEMQRTHRLSLNIPLADARSAFTDRS